MKASYTWLFAASLLLSASIVFAQQSDREKIIAALEKNQCVTTDDKIKVCKYNYVSNNHDVDAISFQPDGPGPFAGLLLIPGHDRGAKDYIPLGVMFAREGFASVAITQPGEAGAPGERDYVGPNTIKVLNDGFDRFKRERFVDSKRMGIYGYSRGGMAASLMAVQRNDVRAAVFGAGIYDFKKAYDETKIEGIKKNMELETGMTPQAIKDRSSILRMQALQCPVLILHGDKDANVPVSQALLLRDKLTELKKEFEVKIFPDKPHALGTQEVFGNSLDFFKRKLSVGPKK